MFPSPLPLVAHRQCLSVIPISKINVQVTQHGGSKCSWFFTPVIRILFLFHENEASVEVHSSLPRRPQCRWLGATLGNLSPTAGHLILNSVVNGLVTEKSSPHRVRQSHFGKRADDQINSFMELSDLIKLLYYILKLINKSYQAIL